MWAYHGQQPTVRTRQNHLQPNTVGCDSGLFQAQAFTADRTTSRATLTRSVTPSPSGDSQPGTAIGDPCGQTEPTLVVRDQTLTARYRWGRLASGVPGSQVETPQTGGPGPGDCACMRRVMCAPGTPLWPRAGVRGQTLWGQGAPLWWLPWAPLAWAGGGIGGE